MTDTDERVKIKSDVAAANGAANGHGDLEETAVAKDNNPLWQPSKRDVVGTPIHKFLQKVVKKYNLDIDLCALDSDLDSSGDGQLDIYGRLHKWSVENTALFWQEVINFCDMRFHVPPENGILDETVPMDKVPKWCPGSELNYAENLLCRGADDAPAIWFAREDYNIKNDVKCMTFGELRTRVQEYAAAMKQLGVTKGDAVAGYMPNSCECVIAMLAATSLGCVWCSTSPDFGADAVLDRFQQVQPKLLFSIECVVYKNKRHAHLQKLQAVAAGLPTVEQVVVIPYATPLPVAQHLLEDIPNAVWLHDFVESGRLPSGTFPALEYTPVPFDQPLYVMFSSGTTGKPKCMVHSVGGTLLKHYEEHVLQNNMTSEDVLFFYTTCGWMMWNWLVSALAVGTSIVLFDGSPFEHDLNAIFDLADAVGMTALGMGAACYEYYEMKCLKPAQTHKLDQLGLILNTGSPLAAHTFRYLYENVKSNVVLGSISGGTDIVGCFVGGTVLRAVYAGECQCALLGMDVRCWDAQQNNVVDQSGELVCAKAFPSMPTHFLNDSNGEKYFNAYFARFPHVWTHGDFIHVNSRTHGIHMLGRSDAVLNPGGVRFGPAEIYSVVETIDSVCDSLAVCQVRDDGVERFVLFVKLADGCTMNNELVQTVKAAIRSKKSPKFIPAMVVECPDIPYTVNGKKVELAVRKLFAGKEVDNKCALRNPECLSFYEQWNSHNQW